ncbi:ComEA family DNA-binding protein, partial [Pseudomonas sp.]
KVKAASIVDHRAANGPFASVDDLLEVKGIGAAILEKNRDRLSSN